MFGGKAQFGSSISLNRQKISEKNIVSIWSYICQMFGCKAQLGIGLSSNRQRISEKKYCIYLVITSV